VANDLEFRVRTEDALVQRGSGLAAVRRVRHSSDQIFKLTMRAVQRSVLRNRTLVVRKARSNLEQSLHLAADVMPMEGDEHSGLQQFSSGMIKSEMRVLATSRRANFGVNAVFVVPPLDHRS
jgi:hypothetical protein